MIQNLQNIFSSKYSHIAGSLAVFLGPFVDSLDEKNWFAVLSFVLVSIFLYGAYDEWKKSRKFNKGVINIPVVIKIDEGPDSLYVMKNLIQKIEEKNNLSHYEEDLKKYLGLTTDTLIFEYTGSIYEFNRLISFARIIKYRINQLEKQLSGRIKFHVAYYKRPAIGFLLGSIFRTELVVIYQNNDAENRFYPVADIVDRKYKERVEKHIKYKITKNITDYNDKELLIIIESASHNIKVKAHSLLKFKNIIQIKLKENGTIPYESDWILYANEIYNVFNEAQIEFNSITVAHAMPEAISVILGMAFENYWNINITQYDKGEYKLLFNIEDVVYYF